jgi:large subunit ribosomal protein L10
MLKNNKPKIVEDIKSKVEKSKSIVLTDYKGLNTGQITTLRTQLKEKGADSTVAKNTLLKIAIKENNLLNEEIATALKGPTMAIFSYNDALEGIKVLCDFIKKNELPNIKSGIVEGEYTTAETLEVLSKLPSKEQLLAQVVGQLKAPLNGLVGTLNGVQRKFVYALSAIADNKS